MFVWTKEAPTVPGWYWCRWHWFDIFSGSLQVRIVEVFHRPGGQSLVIDTGPTMAGKRDFTSVAKAGAEWAGPIPEPKE